ncbi:MAG: serine/threonine protein kinase, partial [Nitrososphaerales archaeon]
VVVKAVHNEKVIALKIRRVDADRGTMDREAELLKLANRVDVGPAFIKSSKNFLLMGLAAGVNIFTFMRAVNNNAEVSNVISEVLEQCYRLDSTGLDHGELSYMRRHVIVEDKITIIDFESASLNRRVSNVTAATQYLFIGGAVAKKVRKLFKISSVDAIISSLKKYKNDVSKENLEQLKQTINL